MKKYILIAVLFCAVLVSQAQISATAVAFVNDTTTNTEIEYMVLAAPRPLQANNVVGIHLIPTTISDTATVTAALQASNDNSVWFNFGSDITVSTAGTVRTYGWTIADTPWKYYRVMLSSTGTGVTKFTGGMIVKPK